MPMSGTVLCKKAVQLHETLHEGEALPPFQASRCSGNFVNVYISLINGASYI